MKFAIRAFLSLAGTLSVALGVTAPADWTSFKLTNVSTASNEYYFWPATADSPDTITTGSLGSWLKQTATPPTWSSSGIIPDNFMIPGELFPNTLGGTIMVNTSAGSLQVVIFSGSGVTTNQLLTNVNGLRCAYATATQSGAVVTYHVSFGLQDKTGAEYVGYATRTGTGTWSIKTRYLGSAAVTGTAVYATTATNGVVYLNYGTSNSVSVLATWTGDAAAPLTKDAGSYGPISVCSGLLYYSCWRDRVTNTTDIRAYDPSAASVASVAVLPALSGGGPTGTRGIRAALAPDGDVRVAVADAGLGTIYYIKGGTLGKVVTIGTGAAADLRGFMFTPSGMPVILYRKSYTTGFTAFPTELVDNDGNGRVDLQDIAFDSTTEGVTVLPMDADNRLKIQFPVVGAPVGSPTTANAISLKNTTKNLSYTVQSSTDLVNWVAPTNTTTFKITVAGTTNNKIATGVFGDPVPGANPVRFARVVISRLTDNF